MNLEFQNIAHHYGDYCALANINLVARSGEVTCLLGSSGCGKTTLLNLAAGLLAVQQGSIQLDGQVFADRSNNPPPEKRPVGLVFQDGALFPHMTIAQNIAFGLGKGVDQQSTVESWLEMIDLAGLGDRYPGSLSGGQQQRVALARAMAPEPAILLLDEPFASIDVVLRRELRRECRRLLKSRNATAIIVTHDPEEAMDIGDKIAVMEAGKIVQHDTPEVIFDAPASLTVGAMFGDAQIISAQRTEGGLATSFGVWPLSCLANELTNDTQFDLLVRGAALDISNDPQGFAIRDIRRNSMGQRIVLTNDAGEELTVLRALRDGDIPTGPIAITPRAASIFAYPR